LAQSGFGMIDMITAPMMRTDLAADFRRSYHAQHDRVLLKR
jgi:hypothetical protein